VHKKLRARKDELRKLVNDDDIIKYNAANLLLRQNPTTSNCNAVVTAVTHMEPPPPSPHVLPTPSHLPPLTSNDAPHTNTCKIPAATSHAHQVVANATTLNKDNGKG